MSGAFVAAAHVPVLLQEAVECLLVQPGCRYVDCTLGSGGHAEAILRASMPHGRLLGIDADPEAIKIAGARLEPYREEVLLVNDNFDRLESICRAHNFAPVQGIMFDLGMSALQLQDRTRGFSFQLDAPLDMRFSPTQTLTAAEILNTFSVDEIASLIKEYGEERRCRFIARQIVQNRPIATSLQLARLVERVAGGGERRIHPATRVFQALRIAVNQELECLKKTLEQAANLLAQGGRVVVISYHSLEDRLVKEFFQQETRDCLCPPEAPACTCGHSATLRLVTRRVIRPSPAEIEANPRSRSAKLRAAERLASTLIPRDLA